MRSCFFIGHRNAPANIRDRLAREVERHIEELGVTQFIVGRYGAFDTMAAGVLREAKHRHPAISLQLLLPYHPAQRLEPIPEGFDSTMYPFVRPVPQRIAIARANRQMVDTCDFLIAYVAWPGNARNLLEYAKRPGAKIIVTNLA